MKLKDSIAIYKSKGGEVELKIKLEKETVWLTQKQIATLFDKGVPTINEHIQNIYKEGELKRDATIRNFRIVQKEGGRTITRNTDFYNLDAIISVGYRVNSQKATQFRIWATRVLKNYLLKGYAINEKRLLEAKEKFNELQNAIAFLRKKSKAKLLEGQEKEILNLLADYSKTLSLLEQYDTGKLSKPKGLKAPFILKYEDCTRIISELKKELIIKKESGDLFGQERGGTFEGIIKGLYQTFGKKELYQTIEDKVSQLFYLVIKDHPFSDGNKRIASFLFVYFLDKCKYLFRQTGERKINDNALTALALLIAESNPKEKDVMVALIAQLIK